MEDKEAIALDEVVSDKTNVVSLDSKIHKSLKKGFKKSNDTKDNEEKSAQVPSKSAVDFSLPDQRERVKEMNFGCSSFNKVKRSIPELLEEIKRSGAKTVNIFYLETVASGKVEDVNAIFDHCISDPSLELDPDCVNQDGLSALTIAARQRNAAMCECLLTNEVSVMDSLLFAIEVNFLEGVKIILEHNSCEDVQITTNDHHFPIRMTPMILAALKNDYKILYLLHKHGHKLKDPEKWPKGIESAMESSTERAMKSKALASPAYITLISEVEEKDAITICLQQIEILRKLQSDEHEECNIYKRLMKEIEGYMCDLLDQIHSTEELSQLFQFEIKSKRSDWLLRNGSTSRKKAASTMDLLDVSCKHRLYEFTTHRHSQLALSCMWYSNMPLLEKKWYVRYFGNKLIALLFPIWSLFYLVAPFTSCGGIATIPKVACECHWMSELAFAVLLLIQAFLKSIEHDYFGKPPTIVEWMIVLWEFGKVIVVYWKFKQYRFELLRDWNFLQEAVQLALFAIASAFRIQDYILHMNDEVQTNMSDDPIHEPRVYASTMWGWAGFLVFWRLSCLLRTSKMFGPLQIALTHIVYKVLKFIAFYAITMLGFTVGLTLMYSCYDTTQDTALLCDRASNSTEDSPIFTSLTNSFSVLFWGLFGMINIDQLGNAQGTTILSVARTLIGTYMVVAIIIVLNMLIVIIAIAFETIRENKEIMWKFYRTEQRIWYIRREFTRPPPMNLIPNPYYICRIIKRCFVKFKVAALGQAASEQTQSSELKSLKANSDNPLQEQLKSKDMESGTDDSANGSTDDSAASMKLTSAKMISRLVQRYKLNSLLRDPVGLNGPTPYTKNIAWLL